MTPIEFISKLPIASRPVMRRAASEMLFTDLRAIPWVFAWNQCRLNVPGWFGIGHALQQLLDQDPQALEQLQYLYQHWPFFRLMLINIQQEMLKTHLLIAQLYNAVTPNMDLFSLITQDFMDAKTAILKITQAENLLPNNTVLLKSIRLRNPYTDVLHLLQIELLQRVRNADKPRVIEQSILQTLTGLAAALQTTG
jgi:phosphoenolpyruvate carboxylase